MKRSKIRNSLFLLIPGFGLLFSNAALSQCAVNAGPDLGICSGQNATLNAAIMSGNPNKFVWTSIPVGALPATEGISVEPTTTTTYIVHATGNGCNVHDTVVVSVYPVPATPVYTLTLDSSCSGTLAYFSIPNPVNGVTYTWNFGDSTTGTGASVSHTFNSYGYGPSTFNTTVTATGGNGCISTYSKVLTVPSKPSSLLLPGGGVDTLTFNGAMTFYICAAAAQQLALFTFANGIDTSNSYTTTILWGDTGAPFIDSNAWSTVNHVYARGLFNLAYIVTNNNTGCTDTTFYKVFYGSNPAGGIASPGNTDICGPGWLTFTLSNFQNNTAGTIYTVQFSDSTPPLIFNHPPPDSIAHYFQRSSCGFSSSNGITTFPNSFSASLTVQNPCGFTAGSVVPIYVSLRPKASYTYGNVCTNTPAVFTNTSTDGMAAGASGCSNTTPILWSISPATGWSVDSGNLGNNNGYTGNNFNPSLWTSGSNTLVVTFTVAGNYQFQIIAGNKCTADTSVGNTICVSAAPSPTFSLSSASGCAPVFDTVINNTVPPAGCSAPTFSWSFAQGGSSCTADSLVNFVYLDSAANGTSKAFLQFNNQGTYNVSLNAQNVCGTFTSTSIVNVKTPPQVTINSPAQNCISQTFSPSPVVQPCGGMVSTYNWSFPGGVPSSSTNQNPGNISYATQGQYSISLTATNECGSANTNTNIVIDTIPVASAGSNQQTCSGSSLQIGSSPANGLTYSWTPVNGLSSPNAANPTLTLINNGTTPVTQTYYLTVSNAGGCSSTDSVVITVYPQAIVNAGPDIGVCAGQSVTLAGTFGGAASSATWTSANGGTFSNLSSLTSTYTPSITSGSVVLTLTTNAPGGPCPAASSSMSVIVVAPPVANAGNNVSVCSGSTVQIGTAKQNGYTYSWSPSTGLNKANIATPTVSLTNNTASIIAQTYTLLVSATGCSDTAQVTVSVYPAATANAGPTLNICAGGTINLNGSIGGAATSATWSSASGVFGQADSLSTTFKPNISSGNAVVTLTTNQPTGPCPAAAATLNVTVNPVPVVTLTPSIQTICSGMGTQSILLKSNMVGTNFSWTGSSPNGVTGYTRTGAASAIPSQTLSDTSSGVVVYTITPTASGCAGLPVNDTVFVNPAPVADQPLPQTICSGVPTTTVNLTSNTTGVTFSWVASAGVGLSGYTSSGSGNILAETLTNGGTNIDTLTYTITPSANGCIGTPVYFNIVVDPPLQISLPPTQSVCSGATTSPVSFTSNAPGTTYSWTASASNGISGFTTGGTGNIPAQTLVNTSGATGSVIYTINSSGNGCSGSPQNYLITVDPVITATAMPSKDTVCTGVAINISLNSNVPGATFSWTVNAPAGITGASAGTGNSIQQTLINSNLVAQTISYIVTPAANGCASQPDTVTVVVNPGLSIQFSPIAQIICSGQTTQPVTISSPTIGATFTWTSQANGVSGVQASGSGSIPAQTLTNNTQSPDTVLYLVVPNSTGCPGQTATYPVVVNPGPSAVVPTAQRVCSGTPTQTISLSSNVPGVTFTWTASASNSITGYTASGNSDSIPSQTILNNGNTQGQLLYSVTPAANGCTGPPVNYIITIEPLPSLILPAPQIICSGGSVSSVVLTTQVPGSTFSWTSSAAGTVSGNIPSGTGNIPSQTLANSGTSPDTVVYTVTTSANGCNGKPVDFAVIINPMPALALPMLSQSVCSGQTSQEIVLSSPGATVSWTAQIPQGLSGGATSGTNVIPPQTLYNNTVNMLPQPLTIEYSVSLSNAGTGCPTVTGNYQITVNPKPKVDFSLTSGTGCSPVTIDFLPVTSNFSAGDSLTFVWGDGTPNLVVYPSGIQPMWTPVQHKFYNKVSKPVTYEVRMLANTSCLDTSIVHPVTVAATSISAFFTPSSNTGCEPLTVAFSDQSSTGSIISWCFNYNPLTRTCDGSGIVDTAGAIVTHTFSAGTYTVALYATNVAGCAQDTAYQTITVSPAPVAAFEPSGSLCSQTAINFTNQSVPASGSFVTESNWQFGDGTSSSLQNPTHVYATAGTYQVCLTATSGLACTDTACHPVTVADRPQVNFSLPNACLNQQTGSFTNRSTGATLYEWWFGDGTTSAAANPNHPYMAAGTYRVQLVGYANSCSDTMAQSVTIFPLPQASFNMPASYGCGFPSYITMNNTSTGAIGYTWDFGNGTGSTYTDPTATYTAQGTYIVTLVATNDYGCSDTVQAPVSAYPLPSVHSVNITAAEGCQPVNVNFNVAATNANNYVWNFGDGSTTQGSSSFESHLYTDTGTFSVIIQVYSENGCGDTLLLPDTVTVHVQPTADFNYVLDETAQQSNGVVQFINTSLNSTYYTWNFSDGSTTSEVNPAHMFPDADQFRVMLIASTPYGCKDTAYKDLDVIKKSLYAPNAFAPDFNTGNSLVQLWKPAGMGLKDYHAQIFDKWGELLWESTALTADQQPAEGWDGTYQGKKCQQDVYVWKIDATFVDGTRWTGTKVAEEGQKESKTIGSVTLIR